MGNANKTRFGTYWKRYVFFLAIVWTLIIAVSLVWNLFEVKRWVVETARIQANMAYEKNIMYRRWNTEHGGVYVKVTDDVKPNPYLKNIPDRDLKTLSGKMLTLINPALMMREVYEMTEIEHGFSERLVSLDPLNPDNMPDKWEADAIRKFERGALEVDTLEVVDGFERMRLIRPLTTEKSCLICHASQGYMEGDVQGAISITLPMKPIWKSARRSASMLVVAHVLLWLLGGIAIILAATRLRRSEEEVKSALGEKEILLREIHHRVKNNLNILSGLLQIQSRAIERGSEQPGYDMLDNFRDRVKSMAEIHELLHNSKDVSKVNFHECVDVVGRDLVNTYGMSERVNFKVNGDVDLGLDLATQSSLIVSELITNSLRHAFPENRKGNIDITLSQDDHGEVIISVADDGVGIDRDIDWKHPVSIGLDLVNGLVIQIGATLNLDRSKGTNFIIKFTKNWRKSGN